MNREPVVQKARKPRLEDITKRKLDTLEDIRMQKIVLTGAAQRIFSPFGCETPGNSNLLRKLNNGIAIFDGILIGYKIFRNVRRLFRRR